MIPHGNQLFFFELQIPNRALTMFPLDSGPSPDKHVVHTLEAFKLLCRVGEKNNIFLDTHAFIAIHTTIYVYLTVVLTFGTRHVQILASRKDRR